MTRVPPSCITYRPVPRPGLRRLGAAALLFLAWVRSGLGAEPLTPLEVREAARTARVESIRQALRPAELSALIPPPGDVKLDEPREWAYRNAVTGALWRAAGGAEGRFQTGLDRLERGLLEEAAEAFAEARESYPDHPRAGDAAFWLGEIRRRQGRIDEAVAFLRQAHGQREHEASYRLGWLLSSQGRGREAAAVWQRLSGAPGSRYRARASVARGAALLVAGDVQEARAALEAVVAAPQPEEPPEAEARFSALLPFAVSRQLLGDLTGAQRALLELLLERPDHPAAPAANLALAWALLEAGSPKEALARFSWVLENSPPEPGADRARLGKLLAQVDTGDATGAVESLSALGGRDPWTSLGKLAVAGLSAARGDWASAHRWAAPSDGETRPPDLAVFLSADALRLLDRHGDARRTYAAVSETGLLRPVALHGQALAALSERDLQGAAALLETVLRQGGYSEADRVRLALAETFGAQGRTEDARRVLEEIPPTSPVHADALLARADAAGKQLRWAEASALLSRFVSRFPGDPRQKDALLALARAELRLGAHHPALDALDAFDSQAKEPAERSEGRVERGRVLAAAGRDAEARSVLEGELARGAAGSAAAAAHQMLGSLDVRAGKWAAALAHFDAALAVGPDPETGRAAVRGRAECLLELGRFEEALQSFRSLGATPDGFLGQAVALTRLGRSGELEGVAAAYASAAGGEAGSRGAVITGLLAESRLADGRSLLAKGDPAGALRRFEAAAASGGPSGVAALAEIARYHDGSGADAEALSSWDRLAAATAGEEKCRALRAAARRAERVGDVSGARERLSKALSACPRQSVELRQALLADLGELELRAGRYREAADLLRKSADAAFGAEGLRALVALARVQEVSGNADEALETHLRIGYLYGSENPAGAESFLRAAALLEASQKAGRARALYQKVARQAQGEWAERGRRGLARLTDAAPASPAPPSSGAKSPASADNPQQTPGR